MLIITSLMGSTGNLLVITVLSLTSKLHTVGNVFIINQAMVDFLLCAILLPFHIAILAQNSPPGNSCSVLGVAMLWLTTTSFLGLPIVAYSRYIIIVKTRMSYKKYLGRNIVAAFLLAVWLFPGLLVCSTLIGSLKYEYSLKSRDCFIRQDPGSEYFLIFKSFFLYIGPVFGLFFLYFKIYDHLRDNKPPVESAQKRDARITRNLFVAFLIGCFCLMPINIAVLSDRQGNVPGVLLRLFISLSWINKATNPILYIWGNKLFIKGLWGFIYRLLGREDLRRRSRVVDV